MSSWYSELFLWSLLTFVTVMLNEVVFSVGDTTQILYHYELCAVRELITMSVELLFLSTQTEGKIIFISDWFSVAAFLFRNKFTFVMTLQKIA